MGYNYHYIIMKKCISLENVSPISLSSGLIPATAADLMRVFFGNADDMFRPWMMQGHPYLTRVRALYRGAPGYQMGLEDHKRTCSNIGDITGLQGPALLNPLGGMDMTGFFMSPRITDVLSISLDSFGDPHSAGKTMNAIMTGLRSEDFRFWSYTGFDPTRLYFSTASLEQGLGAIALLRIREYLQGQITSWNQFKLTEEGSMEFIMEPYQQHTDRFTVIQFLTPDNVQRRYWHIRQRLDAPEPEFIKFMERVVFQSVLIKGAHTLGATIDEKISLQPTLIRPAKRNRATIATDRRDATGESEPYGIWQYWPRSLKAPPEFTLGYSEPGDLIFHDSPEKLFD